jgi:hypothetical protein
VIDWTPELEESICTRLIEGKSLRSIAGKDGIPAESTVYLHIIQSTAFSEKYARAREAQMEAMAADIIEIADDSSGDIELDGEGKPRQNAEFMNRSRLRVDTRKWLMSKLAPKKYGEKQQVALTDPEGGPLRVVSTVPRPPKA